MNQRLKYQIAGKMVSLGIDAAFRFVNRQKLLVVMYHGVTRQIYDPPIWTQLPVEVFRKQLEFLQKHYAWVTLDDAVRAIQGQGKLPRSAALITFDDGLKNNYDVAFPVLSELGVPATVFLTVNLIGTAQLLWFDELYFLLRQGYEKKMDASFFHEQVRGDFLGGELWDAYCKIVSMLKQCGEKARDEYLRKFKELIPLDTISLQQDFGLLDWHQVGIMHDSGLLSFGVHTASHRILSELSPFEWEEEILTPRRRLEEFIGRPVLSFCYPNGRAGIDFDRKHLQYIRKSGYACAFTTENRLFLPGTDDPMTIGRVPAGNDSTSWPSLFRLNSSGCFTSLRGRKG